MSATLNEIRDCLDGEIPGVISTCALDGTPNCSYVSQVHFIDGMHVALSFQFFNKTRENVLANPLAAALVIHPLSAARYCLRLHYLRTETEGPVFESMKAKLAGIASHTGMSGVFRLQGADIYRVTQVLTIAGPVVPHAPPRNLLPAVRSYLQAAARYSELSLLLEGTLAQVEMLFGVPHSMIHWLDDAGERLYLVASRGYAQSGVGSEIQVGQGLIGAAARARTAIRVKHATAEFTYNHAARESVRQSHLADRLEAEVPLPGLARPGSQLAVPIAARGRLLGVLYLETEEELAFGYDEEDAFVAVADHLALTAQLLGQAAERVEEPPRAPPGPPATEGRVAVIRHYAADDTVFIDDGYLIKGVAGAILWKLLGEFQQTGRQEFTNRELRLDSTLPLPELSSNLEARLILLQRRLAERCAFVALEKAGRGRLKLRVTRPLRLVESA